MPLTRYAVHSRGIERHVAPSDDSGPGTLQRVVRETCGWVIGRGSAFKAGVLPDDLPGTAMKYPHPGEIPG